MSIDFPSRARALVGTRFRLQGRGDEGLDCVGVVLAVFEIPLRGLRSGYAVRGNHVADLQKALLQHFQRVRPVQMQPGDVLLLQPGRGQHHLAVRTDAGFVHAHASLRRVVETPGLPGWPLLGVYRKRER
jgi:cell wall-associated NlpC family hydrolase